MTDTATIDPIHADLIRLGACEDARQWAAGKTRDEVWTTCERPDWLLWWAGRCSGGPKSDGRKRLVLCACDCAKLVLPIFEKRYPKDDRPRKAIETAEAWTRGEATLAEVRKARAAADAAAADAADAAAADAAAYAADAAAAPAYAAYAAAAAYAARAKMRAEYCAVVRRHYPVMPEAPKL